MRVRKKAKRKTKRNSELQCLGGWLRATILCLSSLANSCHRTLDPQLVCPWWPFGTHLKRVPSKAIGPNSRTSPPKKKKRRKRSPRAFLHQQRRSILQRLQIVQDSSVMEFQIVQTPPNWVQHSLASIQACTMGWFGE